jgi:hypothetical protein
VEGSFACKAKLYFQSLNAPLTRVYYSLPLGTISSEKRCKAQLYKGPPIEDMPKRREKELQDFEAYP